MSAITRSADHHYTYEGQTYPGATSILSVLDKSGPLMAWASRETANAAIRMAADLPKLIETVGEDGARKALTAKSGWERDEAARLGTEVHRLADLVVTGQPTPPMPENVRTRVLAYSVWWKASGWTLRLSEAAVVHPDAHYGGTFDLLARDPDGRTILADIKTGKGVYSEAALQLAAYGMAPLVAPFDSDTAYPMPTIDRYVIIHVLADTVREIEVPVGDAERQAFLACCDLAAWRDMTKGRRL